MSSAYPQIFTASATTKQRGTLIAFHGSIPFTPKSETRDPEERYIILSGYIMDTGITVVSYYAPNKQSMPFFYHISYKLYSHTKWVQ